MSRRLFLAAGCALGLFATAQAQQLKTYAQSQVGSQFLTYGLPVPLPIDSLTPVDGFRSYGSVQARLQGLALESTDLSAHDVGRSMANRTVWAYVVGDEDGADVEGRPEAAFFINASTHAREWGTPEVSTGTIERLLAGAGDGGIVRYLLDNTRLVIIPVQNVDGVLQTQRYPTDVLVGQDPDFPAETPRDGRMRRKNMRGADEVLVTTGDHLLGVDLNRNHPPFWATAPGRSSTNPASLVHHGAGPHSEPENQAILAAAHLGPETRYRLGIDLHTFSRVFFSSNTARVRLNSIQRNLISVMQGHHAAWSGAFYDDVPDPANRGIGAAAEYFAYQWLVPAWTLELEPRESAFEYGGTNVTHSGFILPASEARRVRESWAETHLVAFYRMAGPAHLSRVRYVDAQTGVVAAQVRWRYNAQNARRDRVVDVEGTLLAGRRYRAELGFSKPMRYRNAAGQLVELPGGVGASALSPVVTQLQGATRTTLDVSGGTWLDDPARVLHYRDDTFAFEFDAPGTGDYTLEVSATDMTGLNLDADASTPVDWAQGAWSEYENALGVDGDLGGADRSTLFAVSIAPAAQVSVLSTDALAGEGDAARLRVSRAAGSVGRLDLRSVDGTLLTTWVAGESGERSVVVPVADDTMVDGDRNATIPLIESIDGGSGATITADVRVLDNDDATRTVWRLHADGNAVAAWSAVAATPRGELVFDGNTTYSLPSAAPVRNALTLRGNLARIDLQTVPATSPLVRVEAGGELAIDRLTLVPTAAGNSGIEQPVFDNAGTLSLTRSGLRSPRASSAPILRNAGQLRMERSAVQAWPGAGTSVLEQNAGSTQLQDSALIAVDEVGNVGSRVMALQGGTAAFRGSVIAGHPIVTSAPGLRAIARASYLQDIDATPCAQPALESEGDNVASTALIDGGCLPAGTNDAAASEQDVLDLPDIDDGDEAILLKPHPGNTAIDHVAAACSLLDQRGAPRPQAAIGTPRCDSGSYEAGLNPYRGIWSPARSGHGVDLQTSGNRLFLAWYTYEDDGQPTAYQAVAPFGGAHWEATLQQSSRDPQSGALTVRNVGSVTIDFADDTHATLGWRFDARGTTGSEAIAASLFAPGEPRFEVTGLWYPPAESGHGATISRRGEVTAVGVYYYDAQGNVRWALGTGNAADAQRFAMTSFRGFCPDCDAASNPVTGTSAGTALAHFHTPVQARIDLQLTYPGAAGGTWNRDHARFVPLNDPVDNTDALRAD